MTRKNKQKSIGKGYLDVLFALASSRPWLRRARVRCRSGSPFIYFKCTLEINKNMFKKNFLCSRSLKCAILCSKKNDRTEGPWHNLFIHLYFNFAPKIGKYPKIWVLESLNRKKFVGPFDEQQPFQNFSWRSENQSSTHSVEYKTRWL